MTNTEYTQLVEKLAEEIVNEGIEVEAGVKEIPGAIGKAFGRGASAVGRGAKRVSGFNDIKAAGKVGKNKAIKEYAKLGHPDVTKSMMSAKRKMLAKGTGKAIGLAAGTGAGAYGTLELMKRRKAEKQAEEYENGMNKSAEEIAYAVFEKAAEEFDNAQALKIAAEEAYAEAEALEEAALNAADETGILDYEDENEEEYDETEEDYEE